MYVKLTRKLCTATKNQNNLTNWLKTISMSSCLIWNMLGFVWVYWCCGCHFYLYWKPEYPEKNNDLLEVIGNLYHIELDNTLNHGLESNLIILVVINTDCIGRCKSNNRTIMAVCHSIRTLAEEGVCYISMHPEFYMLA